MQSYMLDTDTVSMLSRDPRGRIYQKIADVGPDRICLSLFTKAEILYGCEKNQSNKLKETMWTILDNIRILQPPDEIAAIYAKLRNHLRLNGTIIGANDLWIAAHALVEDCVMVTGNTREFARVPDLSVENWTLIDRG